MGRGKDSNLLYGGLNSLRNSSVDQNNTVSHLNQCLAKEDWDQVYQIAKKQWPKLDYKQRFDIINSITEQLLNDLDYRLRAGQFQIMADLQHIATNEYNSSAINKGSAYKRALFTDEIKTCLEEGVEQNLDGLPWNLLNFSNSQFFSRVIYSKIKPTLFPNQHGNKKFRKLQIQKPSEKAKTIENILSGFYSVPADQRDLAWREAFAELMRSEIIEYQSARTDYSENQLVPLDQQIVAKKKTIHYSSNQQTTACGQQVDTQTLPPTWQVKCLGDLNKAKDKALFLDTRIRREPSLKHCEKCYRSYISKDNINRKTEAANRIADAGDPLGADNFKGVLNKMQALEDLNNYTDFSDLHKTINQTIYQNTAEQVKNYLVRENGATPSQQLAYLNQLAGLSSSEQKLEKIDPEKHINRQNLESFFNRLINERNFITNPKTSADLIKAEAVKLKSSYY